MTENGWVCENYEEFRQHFSVESWDNMTEVSKYDAEAKDENGNLRTVSELREVHYRTVWDRCCNKVVQIGQSFVPCLDIRFLAIAEKQYNNFFDYSFFPQEIAFEEIWSGYWDLTEDEEDTKEVQNNKENMQRVFNNLMQKTSDDILKKYAELYDYYAPECKDRFKRQYTYGEIVVPEGYKLVKNIIV